VANTESEQPQLEMGLDSFEALPEVKMPAGYSIRTYQQGDASHWCRLIASGIGGQWNEKSFRESVAGSSGFDPQSLFFVETEGLVVGTACATWHDSYPSDTGYVHMLAVDPVHQGHGLGKALMLSVLHRLHKKGFRRAVLQTDDFRLPAIRLYLGLGFRPRFTHDSHQGRWNRVYQEIGLPQQGR